MLNIYIKGVIFLFFINDSFSNTASRTFTAPTLFWEHFVADGKNSSEKLSFNYDYLY